MGKSLSSWAQVGSGVPQGSCLGPILFLLFINDLPQCCKNSNCSLFLLADDAKCAKIIRSVDDCASLQLAVVCITRWSIEWQLPLSLSKCSVISFTLSDQIINYQYPLCSIVLTRVDNIVDLGILFSSGLSFASHIDKICCTARTRAALILKCFTSQDKKLLYNAFTTFVRPTLEYASIIWNPYRLSDIRKIESIQRRFTKRLFGLENLSYDERLSVLNSESLRIRRSKTDLKMCFSILKKFTVDSYDSMFVYRFGVTRSTFHALSMPKFANNFERYLFKNRCINLWNALPESVVNATSMRQF